MLIPMPPNRKQFHTVTDTDLIFIKQLEFDNTILDEIQNYDYQPIINNTRGSGVNFVAGHDEGGARVIGTIYKDNIPIVDSWTLYKKPVYMEKIQQMVVDAFREIDQDAVVNHVVRSNLNIFSTTDRMGEPHQDIVSTWGHEWSMLVHLNDSDGPTDFFISQTTQEVILSVPFKPGQLIIFPSVYSHCGRNPTANPRYSANYIMSMNTKLNNKVKLPTGTRIV